MYYKPAEAIKLIPAEDKARLPGPQRRAINSIQTYLALAQAEARNGYGPGLERCIGGAVWGAHEVLEQNFLQNPAGFLERVIAEAEKISGYVAVMPDEVAKKHILRDFKHLYSMREQLAQHASPEIGEFALR